jgi:hypothetical protein
MSEAKVLPDLVKSSMILVGMDLQSNTIAERVRLRKTNVGSRTGHGRTSGAVTLI